MGWSIGGGVKFTSNDIFEVNAGLQKWRTRMKVLTRAKMMDLFVKHAHHKIDNAAGRELDVPTKALAGAWSELMDAQREIKKTGYRNPRCDFDFEISILPFEGALYGIIHCEHDEWIKKFKASGLVTPFYWFDSEKPSNVLKKEWVERERVWKGIFEKDTRPDANGFKATMTIEPYNVKTIRPAEVAAAIKKIPFEKRVHRVAYDMMTHARMMEDAEYQASKDEERTHGVMAALFRATDWLKTEEGKIALDAHKSLVAFRLPRFITVDML